MSDPDIVGPLFSPHLIEEAALRTLRDWLPVYRDAIYNRYKARLPKIESWGLENSTAKRQPEQKLPSLIVVADGIGQDGAPEEHTAGLYRASWIFGVAVVIESGNPFIARRNAQMYGAAVRGAILQHRSLGLDGCVSKWLDESYPFGSKESKTRAVAESLFAVEVDEVVNWQMGPKGEPPSSIPAADPEITEVDVKAEVE